MCCPCKACDGRAMESGCRVPTCVHVEDAVMKGMREQGVEIGMMGCGTRVRARRVLERDESGVEEWWWEGWVVQKEKKEVQPFGCALAE